MRVHPAVLIAPVVLLIACSSSTNNKPAPTTALVTASTVAASSAPTNATPDHVDTVTPSPAARPAGSAVPSQVTPPPKDGTALARQLLLAVSDFPAGWAEKPKDTSPSPLDKCKPPKPAGETGTADTGDFAPGNGDQSVSESVAIFDTPAHAAAALDVVPALGDCIIKAVQAGKLDTDKAVFSNVSFSPVSFPSVGDRSTTYRLQLHVKAKGQTGFGSEADVFADLVYIQVGRADLTLNGSDILSPFDAAQLQQIAMKATARVSQ